MNWTELQKQLIEWAGRYAAAGYYCIPVEGKKALYAWGSESEQNWIRSESDAARLIIDPRTTGLALITKNFCVLDVDVKNGGLDGLARMEKEHGPIKAAKVKTGGGGFHFYFARTDAIEIKNSTPLKGYGCDFKNGMSYVVVPPSTHDNGIQYEWLTVFDQKLEPCPQWLIELVNQNKRAKKTYAIVGNEKSTHTKINNAIFNLVHAQAGERDNLLIDSATTVASAILDNQKGETLESYKSICRSLLIGACEQNGLMNEKSEREIEEKIDRVFMHVENTPPEMILLGDKCPQTIADAFAKWLNRRLIKIYFWRDDFWKHASHIMQKAEKYELELYFGQFMQQVLCEERKIPLTTGLFSNVFLCLKSTLAVDSTKSEPFWIQNGQEIDAKELVITRSGAIDPVDMRVIAKNEDLFCTSVVPHILGDSDSPGNWLDFLYTQWAADSDEIKMLQEWFGYCLIGSSKFQKFLWLYGPPRSGKGTILRTLELLSGSFAASSIECLKDSFGLETWVGKKVITIDDVRVIDGDDDRQMNAFQKLLSITGGATVPINRKFKQIADFEIKGKITISSNQIPNFDSRVKELNSRIMLLQTTQSFEGSANTALMEKIIPELPEILRWSLIGLRRLLDHNSFSRPKNSVDILEIVRTNTNPIRQFLDLYTDKNQDSSSYEVDLRTAFRIFCEKNGLEFKKDRVIFQSALIESGYICAIEQKTGKRIWSGIKIRA